MNDANLAKSISSRSSFISCVTTLCLLAVSCAAEPTRITDLPSAQGDRGIGVEVFTSEPSIDDEARSALRMILYEDCLTEQGLVRSPSNDAYWLSVELSGSGVEEPSTSENEHLFQAAFAQCAPLSEALARTVTPPEPDDPLLVEWQLGFQACMAEDGYEIEFTADGFKATPPASLGTDAYALWKRKTVECEQS